MGYAMYFFKDNFEYKPDLDILTDKKSNYLNL